MEEWVDIWTPAGTPSGQKALKAEAHRQGLFHPTVHIWIVNSSQEVLLQLRHPLKETYPSLWDISVAGHLLAGEDPTIGALREIEEEIGLQVTSETLTLIGLRKSEIHHPSFTDREFHHIYLLKGDFTNVEFQLQPSEVADITWIPVANYLSRQTNPTAHKLVPLPKDYLKLLERAILNLP